MLRIVLAFETPYVAGPLYRACQQHPKLDVVGLNLSTKQVASRYPAGQVQLAVLASDDPDLDLGALSAPALVLTANEKLAARMKLRPATRVMGPYEPTAAVIENILQLSGRPSPELNPPRAS